jgi:ABC-type multidrug transport system ATPase subunit
MPSPDYLVKFERISATRGEKTVLHGSGGQIRPGEVIGLRGHNGTGKTTLLKILAGWSQEYEGAIDWRPDGRFKPLLIPAVPREMLFPWYGVRKNFTIYRELAADRGHPGAELNDLEQELVEELDLANLMKRRLGGLSTGELARVGLACGLVFRPNVLMMDEFFTHIDKRSQDVIARVLRDEQSRRRQAGDEMAILLVSHVDSPISNLAQVSWILDKDEPLTRRDEGVLPQR